MPEPALIEALRRKAGEEVEAMWRQARADAQAFEGHCGRASAAERDALERARVAFTTELERTITAGAERTARTIRAAAIAELAVRLHTLAVASLPQLRTAAYDEVFAALAAELPACPWQRVRVSAADAALARRHFPAAAVAVDAGMVGGLEVETDAGRVRVSNSLDTRLAGAWPDLLPVMVKHVVTDLER